MAENAVVVAVVWYVRACECECGWIEGRGPGCAGNTKRPERVVSVMMQKQVLRTVAAEAEAGSVRPFLLPVIDRSELFRSVVSYQAGCEEPLSPRIVLYSIVES